ncbi:MAG: class I SAM-dependent methyltransferase [Candidatus Kapaibacterium sp.]
MDIRDYNRGAWNSKVEQGNQWTVPVGPEAIAAARRGTWEIVLTPQKPVPSAWFPDLAGCDTLCLASGGGQQGPLLAAAGARVTVFDNSPMQLERDRFVAEREGLEIRTVEGDMRDLSCFSDESFDLIIHPCSNCFVPDIRPVWREAFRVLRHGGVLLSGFNNPLLYLFDQDLVEKGIFEVRHVLPYSDFTSITDEERNRYITGNEPLEFGHMLEDQIGGQTDAGFMIAGFYEDYWADRPLAKYAPTFIATRALKP